MWNYIKLKYYFEIQNQVNYCVKIQDYVELKNHIKL